MRQCSSLMRALLVSLLVAVALVSTAVAATRIHLKPLPATSVGRIDGTRAFVAVSFKDGKLRVYVCDGTLKRDASISTWFRHAWDGRRAITLHAGGHMLELGAVRSGGRMEGRLDGHAFRVRAARSPAGLFRGSGGGTRATWIVLPGRAKRGTIVPTRKKCRVVLVSGPNGSQQWVSVCE